MRVFFAFVGEGTSDRALVPLIEDLLIRAGASEAKGTAPELERLWNPPGKQAAKQVEAVLGLEPGVDVIFVHRDADAPTHHARRSEVETAASATGATCIPVIPVQETEAWLLLDEDALRRVAENPKGSAQLNVPKPGSVEAIASPKERLKELLATASELSGKRLAKFKKRFPSHRQRLFDLLEPTGQLCDVPSWQRLVADISDFVRARSDSHRQDG